MKGVFLLQGLEFRLEVKGDEFRQGDPLPCTLSVKNHTAVKQSLTGLCLHLACGDLKKVKQKAGDAFKILSSAECPQLGDIDPQQQVSFPWTFQTDRNCPIADKAQSLFLLCGLGSDVVGLGQLPVAIQPHAYVQEVLRTLENIYQFVLKGQKSSGGWVQAKLKPPEGQRFTVVNELVLNFRFDQDALTLKYVFNVKRIEATVSTLGVTKAKTEVEQRLEPASYLLPGGFINHDFLDATVGEALAVVASKI